MFDLSGIIWISFTNNNTWVIWVLAVNLDKVISIQGENGPVFLSSKG